MKKRALLSIHPHFAEAILRGEKRFEFRRKIFKEDVDEVIIYATAPVSRVVGRFQIDEILVNSPAALWAVTKGAAGISHEAYAAYFEARSVAFAIRVSEPQRFRVSRPLEDYVPSNTPPQSFCYV